MALFLTILASIQATCSLCRHLATAAIVIDARVPHKLIDDREITPQLREEMKRIAELKKGWPKAAA